MHGLYFKIALDVFAACGALFALWKGGPAERATAIVIFINILIAEAAYPLGPAMLEKVNFVSDGLNTPPVFWADYASYDWLALCGLYGKIPNLPAGWPKFPMDIQNLKAFVGFKGDLPKPQSQHDALSHDILSHDILSKDILSNDILSHDALSNVRDVITRYYFLYEYRRNFNLTSGYQG